MEIIIQKFGGTSVACNEKRKLVIDKIKKAIENNYSPVVVVSAMGRKGDPYATDTLLSLVHSNFKKKNAKAVDFLISCGEMISSAVLCSELEMQGIKAAPLTGGQAGIITDNSFNSASVKKVNEENLLKLLSQGIVPVVTGFQGVTEEGDITTLGRGGSDTTASILGVALKAKEIEIYTDVDGIMTADPRIVNDAFVISNMSYNEVFQFADQGAKVIHPRAVEAAMRGNIPLIIKNVLNESKGTIIDNSLEESNKIITGITHTSGRLQVIVKAMNNKNNINYKHLLNILADKHISIDLINVFPEEKIFTINEEDKFNLIDTFKNLDIIFNFEDKCSKLAIIGSGMKGVPGVMASILESLNNENIEVLQTADSYMTIWCLVKTENVERAINILHKKFM
ncbi:aspartate kinase [Clostridium polynesiense]|uniref:aspartate kinase n=1 Tax=Clostridium polynesiense TaxID=1325933 RepID=UPI00058EAF20|nr:aspartate kinase [Clostridium polynesiense]